MSAGASAGVAIAFGAPIGGAIFVYEHNWPNPFWRNRIFQWRTFTASILATLVQTSGVNWYNNDWSEMKGTIISEFHSFYKWKPEASVNDTVYLWVGAVIMGIVGGLCGAFFINVNTRLNYIRRPNLTSKFKKTFECTLFVFVTANFIFWAPYIFGTCHKPTQTNKTNAELEIFRGWCAKSTEMEINNLASYFWVAEAFLEGNILDGALEIDITVLQLCVFWAVWYLFFCTTYGTNIPSGLFSPGIVMGMTVGQIYYQILTDKNWYGATVDPALKRKFMSIGPSAIISGYVRMKYCVAIIILEICEDFSLFIPMFIAVIVSNHVGDKFTRGVYHRLVRTKQCPVLTNSIPRSCLKLKADYIMNPNLKCFHSVEKFSVIAKFLKDGHK
jgi:chloride channel 7